MAFLASVSTIIVATVTVGLYVAVEEVHFSAANIFTALALLGQLTVCLSVFPVTIPILIKVVLITKLNSPNYKLPLSMKGVVSRQRLKEFFSRAEVSIYKEKSLEVKKAESASRDGDTECNDDKEEESDDEDGEEESPDSKKVESPKQANARVPISPEVALSVRGGYFAWPRTSSCVLRDISMEVRPGTLNAVVGPSGSGKTALVSALLEEMDRVRGRTSKETCDE